MYNCSCVYTYLYVYTYDNISNKLIKLAKGVLTQPLTLISNQILRTGIFPKELKISRVKPLFKSLSISTTIGLYRYFPLYQKYLNMSFLIK